MASGTRFHRGDAGFAELAALGFVPDAEGRVRSRHCIQAKGRRRQAATLRNSLDSETDFLRVLCASAGAERGGEG
jgi:hypothetical protein